MIDLGGATLLPGLIDLHTHLTSTGVHWEDELLKTTPGQAALHGARNALVTLTAGFTTCRDMGPTWPFTDIDLRKAIDEGVVPGPRLMVVGQLRLRDRRRRRRAAVLDLRRRPDRQEPRRRPGRNPQGGPDESEGGRRLHQDPRDRRGPVEGHAARRAAVHARRSCASPSTKRHAGAATSPRTRTAPTASRRRSAPASTRSITAACWTTRRSR